MLQQEDLGKFTLNTKNLGGDVPMIGKNLGRPRKTIPESYETVILEKYNKYRLNALYLEKVIYAENSVRDTS